MEHILKLEELWKNKCGGEKNFVSTCKGVFERGEGKMGVVQVRCVKKEKKWWKDDTWKKIWKEKKIWWKKMRGSKKKEKFKSKECACGERSSSIG